jgi:hypothetical protein
MTRQGYEGIAVAVPVTVPYERFSTKGAPWFLGRVLAELVKQSGVAKDHIDGLCVSSFSGRASRRSAAASRAAPKAWPASVRRRPALCARPGSAVTSGP